MTSIPMRVATFFALLFALCLAGGVASPNARGSAAQVSTILNFSPTSFPAKAEASFFYSINKDLKYSDHIDPQAPTLVRGTIWEYLVSPDGTKLAAALNGRLTIVDTTGVIADVAKTSDLGFNFAQFQWSGDSKALYFHKGNYKNRRKTLANCGNSTSK